MLNDDFVLALQTVLNEYGVMVDETLAQKVASLPSPEAGLTPEQRRIARDIFEGHDPGRRPCEDCGGVHARACPRVRSRTYDYEYTGVGDQRLKHYEVVYHDPNTWESDDIVFPDDAYREDE